VALAAVPAEPQRLVYLGTPAMAVPPLEALVAAGWDVAGVVTRADAKRGRGGLVSPSPVKAAAADLGLPVVHRVNEALDFDADLGVVVAYGALVRRPVLERLAMVNLHFSLLPRWRGAAPVERALLAGDRETGVCLMQLEEDLDTGPVFARRVVPIGARATAAELRAELVGTGTALLLETLRRGLRDPEPQRGEPTYAHKLDPAELRLDWEQSASDLDRVVRVGGAWTTVRGRRLKVLEAVPDAGVVELPRDAGTVDIAPDGVVVGTADGSLRLVTVQPEGKGPMAAAAWVNGARLEPHERLGV
jgi:methionyl-tRNA formyltransferase